MLSFTKEIVMPNNIKTFKILLKITWFSYFFFEKYTKSIFTIFF